MNYRDEWVAPWRKGLPQARCTNPHCTPVVGVGKLVVAVTLDEHGLCAGCARTVDETDRRLDA